MIAAFFLAVISCGGSRSDDSNGTAEATLRYQIDASNVPVDLRPLIPLAERWGIGDDVERAAYIDQSTAADRGALKAAVTPYDARITGWLDSFGADPMSDEAAAFMYMQLAIAEMP